MEDRCQKLRDQLWDGGPEREIHIMELEESLRILEPQVFAITASLPDQQRVIIEGYLHSSAELEMYTVIQAFRRGKELGKEIGKNSVLNKRERKIRSLFIFR